MLSTSSYFTHLLLLPVALPSRQLAAIVDEPTVSTLPAAAIGLDSQTTEDKLAPATPPSFSGSS
jgi:hypothetical protein